MYFQWILLNVFLLGYLVHGDSRLLALLWTMHFITWNNSFCPTEFFFYLEFYFYIEKKYCDPCFSCMYSCYSVVPNFLVFYFFLAALFSLLNLRIFSLQYWSLTRGRWLMAPSSSLPAPRWVNNHSTCNNRLPFPVAIILGSPSGLPYTSLCPLLLQTFCSASGSCILLPHLTLVLCWSFNQVSDDSSGPCVHGPSHFPEHPELP